LPVIRSDAPPLLEAFNFADPEMVTGRRDTTIVPAQALLMMNSPFVMQQSREAAGALLSERQLDDAARIDWLYRRSLGRPPSSAESQAAISFIDDYAASLDSNIPIQQRRLGAWASFCQAVFASAEFRFLD
jgi:hypothetical protein